MARFHGHQSIEFGANVGHAPGDHHASRARRTLTTFMDMDDAQVGAALCHLGLAVGWLGTRRGPNGPLRVQTHTWPFVQSLNWSGGGEGVQINGET